MGKHIVQMTRAITVQAPNGEMHIEKIGDSYHLTYHNQLYKGSPFPLPMQFNTDFSLDQIINSSEVITFLARFK